MRKYGAPKKGEHLKVLFPGRCFRNENVDASHENTFFQLEGMMIGDDISIANLIYFMKVLLTEVFERDVKIRLRPGFFRLWSRALSLILIAPSGGKDARHARIPDGLSFCPAA